MNDKPLLIFDHDGTLHDSMYVFGPAMHKGAKWLEENGYAKVNNLTDDKIESFLGMNSKDIWEELVSDMSEELLKKVINVVGEEMNHILDSGAARWFDGIAEQLDILKEQGYKMVILSNCDKRLAGFYWDYFHMEKWFEHFYECESYNFIPKTEIIKLIIKEHSGEAIMIGDRFNDFECAKAADIPFIGCRYGFAREESELDGAYRYADTPYDLAEAVNLTSKESYNK